MRKILTLTLMFTLLTISFGGLASAQSPAATSTTTYVAANFKDGACDGLSQLGGANPCDDGGAQASNKISSTISTIVNILSVVVGIAAVVMIIIAGFKYITAGGDTNNVTSAKRTLIYAIVGLVIVALAQFIVNFVLTSI